MVIRFLRLFPVVSYIVLQVCVLNSPALAAFKAKKITFTPPVCTANFIQVTEVLFESNMTKTKSVLGYGPLLQSEILTVHLQLVKHSSEKSRFRVDWSSPVQGYPSSHYVSNGKVKGYFDDVNGKFREGLASPSFWSGPIEELENSIYDPTPEIISAIPTVRDGRRVLVARDYQCLGRSSKGQSYLESWYDPKTHLLIRKSQFGTWRGKSLEEWRTEYSGWELNVPMSTSLFVVPPAALCKR